MSIKKLQPSADTPVEKAEQNLQAALLQARTTLGNTAPRLLTDKPQVAANSLRHGLTGLSVYLTPMEMRDYLTLGRDLLADLKPITASEILHAQRIIDTEWRLNVAISLGTMAHTAATVLESQNIYAANPHLTNIKSDSVLADVVYVQAQAAALRVQCEGANTLEKLGRHETRLFRLLRGMRQDYKDLQKFHPISRETWIDLDCPAYQWYTEMTDLADALLFARNQIIKDSEVEIIPIGTHGEPVSAEESITSEDGNLLCKKALHMVRPLTARNLIAFEEARANGLITDLEDTLPPVPNAA